MRRSPTGSPNEHPYRCVTQNKQEPPAPSQGTGGWYRELQAYETLLTKVS